MRNLAPQERHNVAHGASRGPRHLPSSPFPSPARAGEGCRRRGGGYSLLRAAPWANIFRPFGATLNALPAQPDLVNEFVTQDTSCCSLRSGSSRISLDHTRRDRPRCGQTHRLQVFRLRCSFLPTPSAARRQLVPLTPLGLNQTQPLCSRARDSQGTSIFLV